ncbi:MAG: bifunctional DNA primase/polymerase [bacterium]
MNNHLLFAKHFHSLGLNITCISNKLSDYNFFDANILKGPYHRWKHLKAKRQSLEELLSYNWEEATGIGTVGGFENLHALDIDGCTNSYFIEDLLLLLGLPKYYDWVVKTGSMDGFHILFYSKTFDDIKPDQAASTFPASQDNTGLFEKIEILWNTHIVLPKSLHKSGYSYKFINCEFPKNKPEFVNVDKINEVVNLFTDINKVKEKKVYFEAINESLRNKTSTKIDHLMSLFQGNLFFIFDIDYSIDNEKEDPSITQISWLIMDRNGIIYKKKVEILNYSLNESTNDIQKRDIISKVGEKPEDVYIRMKDAMKYCSTIISHDVEVKLNMLKRGFINNDVNYDFNEMKTFCTMEWASKMMKIDKENSAPLSLSKVFKLLFNHEVNLNNKLQSNLVLLSKITKEILLKNL